MFLKWRLIFDGPREHLWKSNHKIILILLNFLLKSTPCWLTSAQLHHWGHTIGYFSQYKSTRFWNLQRSHSRGVFWVKNINLMILEVRINNTAESLCIICERKLWQKIKEKKENEKSKWIAWQHCTKISKFTQVRITGLFIVRKGWLKGLIFWQGKKCALLQNTTYLDYQ